MALIPKDLQRFSMDGPNVTPQYIKATPAVIQIIQQILDCFRFSPDDTYGILQDSLEPLCLASQRHRLIRGIIHILEERLEFVQELTVDPITLREELFKRAAQIQENDYINTSWRERICQEISSQFHIPVENIEDCMYADLKSERKIKSFNDIEADDLIAEYNLALAKSLLMYAKNLTFTIELGNNPNPALLRRLFQSLRFFNLLFEANEITETAWQFTVDGPSAVLPQPQKYAISLAAFLPTLYLFEHWHVTTVVDIDGKKANWQLGPDDFQPPKFQYAYRLPEEAETLSSRITEIDPQWQISKDTPILKFGPQAVWIPDFTMRNDGLNISAHVEILGFWRADYLNRRLEYLKNAPGNLILVLSEKLKIDSHKLKNTPIQIVYFKRTPKPQDVIHAALLAHKVTIQPLS